MNTLPEPQPAGATAITPAGQKKVALFSDGTFVESGRMLPWIVLAAVVGVLGWIVMDAWSSTWQEVAVSQTPTASLNHRAKRPPAFADTSTWKTYRNEKYGFEVRYSPSAGAVKYVVDDNCIYARGAVDGIDISQSQPPQLLRKRICIGHSETFPDSMPSISDFWIRIYENPSRLSLIDWLSQNYSDLEAHGGKRIPIGGNTAFVFGDYPWEIHKRRWEQWKKSSSSFSTEGEWLNSQPIPGEPRIFINSNDSRFVYSFTSYPYFTDWDLVLSTFKFIK